MPRVGIVRLRDARVGLLREDETGVWFTYDEDYLNTPNAEPISFTLPLRQEAYSHETMIPFFDGLIPEGWLLDIAEHTWKVKPTDRMALLLAVCRDTIGAVTVHNESEGSEP